jgi:hypothetical protein
MTDLDRIERMLDFLIVRMYIDDPVKRQAIVELRETDCAPAG